MIDLKDRVSIGDRLAALEAVNAETSMRVSELEVMILNLAKQDLAIAKRLVQVASEVQDARVFTCPEPMEDDAA